MPVGETVATAGFDDSQADVRVTSCELPSASFAIAVI
jgi:hypothetical protein